jgi:multidrug resistance efflux pump
VESQEIRVESLESRVESQEIRVESLESRAESQEIRVESLQADNQLRVAVVRTEKLVAEAGYSSGTQRKGNVHCWKPLPSNAVKTVTENTSLFVIVICDV